MSKVLTERMTAPWRAPAEVKNRFTATRNSVRRKMSLLTWKKVLSSSLLMSCSPRFSGRYTLNLP